MKTATLLLTLFASAFCDKSDFPPFDPEHACCAMAIDFPGQDCLSVFSVTVAMALTLNPDPKSGGFYRIKENKMNDYVWMTRQAPDSGNVDDLIFEYAPAGQDCRVAARSRSQAPS